MRRRCGPARWERSLHLPETHPEVEVSPEFKHPNDAFVSVLN